MNRPARPEFEPKGARVDRDDDRPPLRAIGSRSLPAAIGAGAGVGFGVTTLPWSSFEITDDEPMLARALAHLLTGRGLTARVVAQPSSDVEALIVTAALGTGTPQALHWTSLVHARNGRGRGMRAVVLLQDSFTCRAPDELAGWCGGVVALARTAAREWPELELRAIDIAIGAGAHDGNAARVLQALSLGLPVVTVGPTGAMTAPRASAPLAHVRCDGTDRCGGTGPPPRVWLVSGGARGITADCAVALARHAGGTFALLGRSPRTPWPAGIEPTERLVELRAALARKVLAAGERPVPATIDRQARAALAGRQIDRTLQRLEAAGAQASYWPCDLSVPDRVRDTVMAVEREHGAIGALVHGAGTLADRLIVDKTRDELDRVFDTKVGGLRNLLDALDISALSHVALFSSAAAWFGNPGQADYAMANEVLNGVARSLAQRVPAAVVKAFDWGPWNGGMVDAALAGHFARQGVSLIEPAGGAALFADELLRGDPARVEVLVGDPWDTTDPAGPAPSARGPAGA